MITDDALHIKRPLAWQLLVEFSQPVELGNERQVAERVSGTVRDLGLQPMQMGRIRQTIVEALGSATTRGDQDRHNLAVTIRIWVTSAYAPDRSRSGLDATLSAQQEHRGWGFFLVEKHGDGPWGSDVESHHAIELYLYHEGDSQKSSQV